jgi:predicted small integral membrane protein
MPIRISKCLLILSVAFFYSLVVFNNATDYNSNLQFVRHTLTMDSTFPGNHGMWREIDRPAIHTLFYLLIIAWETVTAILLWWSGIRMLRAANLSALRFHQAKSLAILPLVFGMLMWFTAFISVGGEWFLMWQSKIWNGEETAFRIFVILGIILLYLAMPEPAATE